MIVSEKAGRGGREKMYEIDLISQSINRNAIKHVIVNILYYIKKITFIGNNNGQYQFD